MHCQNIDFTAQSRANENFHEFAFDTFTLLKLILRVFCFNTEGRSKNIRASCTDKAYDVIIFKLQRGGGQLPQSPHLRVPMAPYLLP